MGLHISSAGVPDLVALSYTDIRLLYEALYEKHYALRCDLQAARSGCVAAGACPAAPERCSGDPAADAGWVLEQVCSLVDGCETIQAQIDYYANASVRIKADVFARARALVPDIALSSPDIAPVEAES